MEKKKFFKVVKGIFYSLFGLSSTYKVGTEVLKYNSNKVSEKIWTSYNLYRMARTNERKRRVLAVPVVLS